MPNLQPSNYDPTYGGIPNLPPTITDTTATLGQNTQAQMIQNLPNYLAMLGLDTGNIMNNLAGRVNPDVMALLQQQAAERGIATGSPGSPNESAAYLRALGQTSQQLQNLGNTQLTQAMGRTPIQQASTGSQTTDLSALQAIYNAAPIPSYAAAANRNAMNQGLGSGAGAANPGSYAQNYMNSAAQQLANLQNQYQRQLDQQLASVYPNRSRGTGQYQTPTPTDQNYGGVLQFGDWTYDPYSGWFDTNTGMPWDGTNTASIGSYTMPDYTAYNYGANQAYNTYGMPYYTGSDILGGTDYQTYGSDYGSLSDYASYPDYMTLPWEYSSFWE